MRPRPFDLIRPEGAGALAEALAVLATDPEAMPHAGGTELVLALKLRVLACDRLVDLKRLPGLDRIEAESDGGLGIGALATHRRIATDPVVQLRYPALAGVCADIGNARVRAAGTIGGNLCFADPHADPPALLAALRADLQLVGPQGARRVGADDFTLGEYETARATDELLVALHLPAPRGPSAYRNFRHGERPTAGVAVALEIGADGRIVAARLRAGAVGPRPQVLGQVEAALTGAPVAEAMARATAALPEDLDVLEVHADRHGGADYKRHLVGVLACRALAGALGQQEGKGES